MSDLKTDQSRSSTQEPVSLEAQNAALQEQVDHLSKENKKSLDLIAVMSRFWTTVVFFTVAGLIVNFTCLPADMRPLMPKIPKPRLGSECLWFDDEPGNLCSIWTVYTTPLDPMAPDTNGYEDACTAAGRTATYKSRHDGPVREVSVTTWACEE